MQLEKLDIHGDRRGLLVEAFKLPTDGQVFYIIADPFEPRGNHYHLRKTEHFLCLGGSARMSVKDRETGNIMHVEVNGNNPMRISVIPNHTHMIAANADGAILLVWTDEQYDPSDPDTYLEEL